MHAGELRVLDVFGGLTDDQLSDLIAGGTEVRIEPGTELFREGEHADYWWVLLDGAIDLTRHIRPEAPVVGGVRCPGGLLRLPDPELAQRVNNGFPFGRPLTEGLYRTARSIESTARQRE